MWNVGDGERPLDEQLLREIVVVTDGVGVVTVWEMAVGMEMETRSEMEVGLGTSVGGCREDWSRGVRVEALEVRANKIDEHDYQRGLKDSSSFH